MQEYGWSYGYDNGYRVIEARMHDSDTYYCEAEKQECKSPPSQMINVTVTKPPGQIIKHTTTCPTCPAITCYLSYLYSYSYVLQLL